MLLKMSVSPDCLRSIRGCHTCKMVSSFLTNLERREGVEPKLQMLVYIPSEVIHVCSPH